MKTVTKSTYTLIVSDENSVASFYKTFAAAFNQLKKNHLVVQLSDNLNTTTDEIALFLKVSKSQKNSGFSFVLVANNIDVDALPDCFNIVPTLVEAENVLEMEAIERDLGF